MYRRIKAIEVPGMLINDNKLMYERNTDQFSIIINRLLQQSFVLKPMIYSIS